MKKISYDATSSMLGYLYQVRYALYLALKKIVQVEDIDSSTITIESLDDVSFEERGIAKDLIQTKHHVKEKANLNDKNSDIWKTLRIWSEDYKEGKLFLSEDTIRTLVTTSPNATDSIASYLSPSPKERNVYKAIEALDKISNNSKDDDKLSVCHKAYNNLNSEEKDLLVSSVYVVTRAENIIESEELLKKHCRLTVEERHLRPFLERLEGKWFSMAINSMMSKGKNSISLGQLVSEFNELRSQFLPGNLPVDYDLLDIEDEDENYSRNYIKQLQLINAPTGIIKLAKENYYKASKQRSKWSRDSLLLVGELGRYDRIIKDEWREQKELLSWNEAHKSKEEKGAELYKNCLKSGLKPIRPAFHQPYVARGTYQILSEQLIIGWHEDYLDRLTNDSQGEVA
ncbi:ABC-three component system protein [Vibrio cholerae]|uniref:ABC-three component system protein n=1 Tax=Vibrio cholerae TaxID=666 RepID=UPI000BA9CB40|nr:ABC-three component system protein [Vibrio cholerae]PAS29117.1 hypothetical protein CGT71_13205 [Vibrio cholerae]